MAKALERETDTVESYCIGNTSRPLLSFGKRGSKQKRTYLYVEALREFKHLKGKLDLTEAYRKAGDQFKDRLEHCFVFMCDGDAKSSKLSGGNRVPLGNKRKAAPAGELAAKKKPITRAGALIG